MRQRTVAPFLLVLPFLVLTFLVLTGSVTAQAASICPRVLNVSNPILWKAKASDHLSSSDPRKRSTTLIFGRRVRKGPPFSCLLVYGRNGQVIHKLGLYERGGTYSSRYYGGSGCGDGATPQTVAARAASAGERAIYIKVSKLTCLRVTDITGRQGGVN